MVTDTSTHCPHRRLPSPADMCYGKVGQISHYYKEHKVVSFIGGISMETKPERKTERDFS